MSLTSDDLLKKLRPTNTFAVSESDIRNLAKLAISVGADEFVERWKKANTSKSRRRRQDAQPSPLADIKATATRFGAKRKLSSAQTAQAIYGYFTSQKGISAQPTKSAQKGVSAMVDWLAKKTGVDAARTLLEAFFARYEAATDLTHHLPNGVS